MQFIQIYEYISMCPSVGINDLHHLFRVVYSCCNSVAWLMYLHVLLLIITLWLLWGITVPSGLWELNLLSTMGNAVLYHFKPLCCVRSKSHKNYSQVAPVGSHSCMLRCGLFKLFCLLWAVAYIAYVSSGLCLGSPNSAHSSCFEWQLFSRELLVASS